MGEVHTEITLVNIGDQSAADRGFIPRDQVRQVTLTALVDTGAWTLVLNEETRQRLGLSVEETGEATLAGGIKAPCQTTEYVEVRWKDRKTACRAVVLPGETETLLGAYPLEGMDLMVHPQWTLPRSVDTVKRPVLS
ncbi:MAG: retroviral-like aspartic protease family protein [Treponema sp.]|jgi:predicted aspartyl protease|nr:retroviral-like aspartic protease family protein [Treponema sp.]